MSPSSNPPGDIRAYTFDHEGSVWIGTETDGLWQLKSSLFEVWGAAEGVGSDNIYPILEDDEGLWIGTYDAGLTLLLANDTLTRFELPDPPRQAGPRPCTATGTAGCGSVFTIQRRMSLGRVRSCERFGAQ